jgi:hypothetical protein
MDLENPVIEQMNLGTMLTVLQHWSYFLRLRLRTIRKNERSAQALEMG